MNREEVKVLKLDKGFYEVCIFSTDDIDHYTATNMTLLIKSVHRSHWKGLKTEKQIRRITLIFKIYVLISLTSS